MQVRKEILDSITSLYRLRRRWHTSEKALINAGRAACRSIVAEQFPYDPNATDKQKDKRREKIKGAANKMYDAIASGSGKGYTEDDAQAIAPFLAAQKPLRLVRCGGVAEDGTRVVGVESKLEKLARELPIWPWVRDEVAGVAELSLAAIVGECGDISQYRSVSALWKRLGLAVMPDGRRQRKVAGDREKAIANAYDPERRSVVWNIGANILKAQIRKPDGMTKDNDDGTRVARGYLGQVYLDRRKYEKEKGANFDHPRAQRYMEKRFIRMLYCEWKGINREDRRQQRIQESAERQRGGHSGCGTLEACATP